MSSPPRVEVSGYEILKNTVFYWSFSVDLLRGGASGKSTDLQMGCRTIQFPPEVFLLDSSHIWPQAPRFRSKFKVEHKQTFVPIWKKSLQSIPEIGCWWERDWQHANIKPLAMAVTVWTRKTKSRYWARGAPYCITLLNIKPSIRPSYLKDRTLWAIFPFRLLCFNPELHSHSCSSSAGEEVASNCVCLRF